MKKQKVFWWMVSAVGGAVILALPFLPDPILPQEQHELPGASDKDVSYLCPMHPQIRSEEAGACPICGMKLTAQRIAPAPHIHPHAPSVTMTTEEARRVNIRMDQVELGFPPATVKLFGRVAEDQSIREEPEVNEPRIITAHVNFPKTRVLLDTYQADLSLLRFGQSVILTSRSIPERRFKGRVRKVGEVIRTATNTAEVVVDVVDEKSLLKPGMFTTATIKVGLAANGQVAAPQLAEYFLSPVDPFIRSYHPGSCPRSGKAMVRAEELGYVSDPAGSDAVVFIPEAAPLVLGREAVVFVRDEQAATFTPRSIRLGPKGDKIYVVTSGLQPGEEIAVKGAFVLDADAQIRGKSPARTLEEAPRGTDSAKEKSAPSRHQGYR